MAVNVKKNKLPKMKTHRTKRGIHKVSEITGKPHVSLLSTAEQVAETPTLRSGTGRGSAGCPVLAVKGRKPPSYVTLHTDDAGRTRGTIDGVDISAVFRWIGTQGYSWHVSATFASMLGIPSRRNTLVSQTSAGSDEERIEKYGKGNSLRGPIPDVTPIIRRDVKRAASVWERSGETGKDTYQFVS